MQTRKNKQVAFAAVAFLSALAYSSPAHPLSHRDVAALSDRHSLALQERGIPVVDSTIPLKLRSGAGRQLAKRQSGGPLRTIYDGAQYAIDVTIGTETLQVLIDTGSSSFWVPKADFVCVDVNGTQQSQATCGFPKFGPKSFTGSQIPDQNFNVTYGGGEFATGIVGLEDVGFGGVTVKNQKMSFVDRTYWLSAGNLTSGLMGWGLGATTAIFEGADPSQDGGKKPIFVKPWLETAYDQGLVAKPIFSVVLGKRGKDDADLSATGFLTIGGAPSSSSLPLTGAYATTPILKETFDHYQLENEYVHYVIRPDGFVVDGKFIAWAPGTSAGTHYGDSQDRFTILDSGTAYTMIPKALVETIAAAFDPPASFSEDDGLWVASCNAQPPSVAIRVNGTDLPYASSDVLVDGTLGVIDEEKQTCIVGFMEPSTPPWGGDLPYILGANFHRNVLAVHDIGNKVMTFGALKWN
ncbi:hypothetical protein J4E83_009521 [Alternaria metachromatica]|uniref:uncharacterized protein n=1 Tax=Alternaria metachromatica TaxID=283354 RepID=UPI0020C34B96|nr:uncharacterized protein J4E83_009521 [Alternaria metachromatica]KAI4607624.1 hypothetical protein J4E83_009521 [Alternaria metachromatica]